VAQTWPQIVNNLANLWTKYNFIENLLENTNNQLQAYCLELVNNKQALQNKDKELATIKVHIFKLPA
jgi:alkylhydroperoxidase/carboxymuconolactone decarboxylase family protein YurZ